MSEYCVFWIGEAGEVLATSASIEASDDDDARSKAAALAGAEHVEVWQGMRRVALINPKPMPKLGD